MKKKIFFTISTMILLGLALAACIPLPVTGGSPEISGEDLAATAAAQTVQARKTEDLVNTLVAELTHVAEVNQITQTPTATQVPPTETEVPPTATATNTNTPVPPTATSTPPTPTATAQPCYWAKYVADVTITDGTDVNAGTNFTKTWRLKNIGTCTWTSDFDLVFVSGSAMSGPAVVDFPTAVLPGDTVDLSVTLTAPNSPGSYTGYWQLRSANGLLFGLGDKQDKPFWVKIDVPTNDAAFDPDKAVNFASAYQAASWYSSNGSPSSSDNYVNGSIYYTDSPHMEKTHIDDEPALIMIPADGSGGTIYGKYPALNIKDGDHLRGLIGCTSDSPKCDVTFQINYKIVGSGSTENLGSWKEVYEGSWTTLDIDLSFLAGKSVKFTLLVLNNGSSQQDRVFWLAPRIVR